MRALPHILSLWLAGAATAAPVPSLIGGDPSLDPACAWGTGRMTAACLPMFIGHVIKVLAGMLGAFFIISVMIAGFQITVGAATGDKEKGKERLRWSIIGFVVSVLCYVILNVIFSVLTGTN